MWLPPMKIKGPGGRAAHSACSLQNYTFIYGGTLVSSKIPFYLKKHKGYDGKKRLSTVYAFNAGEHCNSHCNQTDQSFFQTPWCGQSLT